MQLGFARNSEDLKIDNPSDLPRDTPSCIQWSADIPTVFGVSSWDCSFRMYNINNNGSFSQVFIAELDEPITTFEFKDDQYAFLGTMTGNIYAVEFKTGQLNNIGCQKLPILKLVWIKERDCLVAFEAGTIVGVYDITKGQIGEVILEDEAVSVDYKSQLFAVGCANNRLALFTLSNLQQNDITTVPTQLNSKISVVNLHENGNNVLIAGYDGRISNSTISTRSYHREIKSELLFKAYAPKNDKDYTEFYPITQCEYAPNVGTKMFYTVSPCGILKNWEYQNRQLCSEYAYTAPIATSAFNKKSQLLVLGLGYDWTYGVWGLQNVNSPPEIIVKQLVKGDFISGN